MDLTFLLIADAMGLIIATIALTYFFFRDVLKDKKKKKRGLDKPSKSK